MCGSARRVARVLFYVALVAIALVALGAAVVFVLRPETMGRPVDLVPLP